jgi:hypothetical protein
MILSELQGVEQIKLRYTTMGITGIEISHDGVYDVSAYTNKKHITGSEVGDITLTKGVDSTQFLIPTANILSLTIEYTNGSN